MTSEFKPAEFHAIFCISSFAKTGMSHGTVVATRLVLMPRNICALVYADLIGWKVEKTVVNVFTSREFREPKRITTAIQRERH